MKIEIRKSFSKDAQKLPVHIQQQLSSVINNILKFDSINQLMDYKKLKGYRQLIE
jgi:mRNA-degrading endonuclease RelE of RelBE toxin-antitoxin system